jgi:ATP-dependent helicase Lhr and Lhr-like helicase
MSGLEGLAINRAPEQEQLNELARHEHKIRDSVSSLSDCLAAVLTPGPWHKSLPDDVQREVVMDLFGVEQFIQWLRTRRLKLATML